MKKSNIVLCIALTLGMVLGLSCGPATPAPTATVTVTTTAPPATVTVTPTPSPIRLVKVISSQPTAATAVFFDALGKEKGFFQKRGIDLQILELDVSPSKVAIFIGNSDITSGDPFAFYPEHKDTRIIAEFMGSHFSVLVRKDSPYRSYKDIKGKKIGIAGPATAQYQMVKVATMLEGLDLEKDFKLIIGSPAVQVGWLIRGEVEAVHTHEPLTSSTLVSDGDKVRVLYWLNDLYKQNTGANLMFGGIFTTDAWVQKSPDVARQVSLAYNDTFRYVHAHDDVWKSDIAKKLWKIDDPKVLEMVAQRMPSAVGHPPYGPTYKAGVVKQAQYLANAGIISQEAVEWYKGIILFAEPWK